MTRGYIATWLRRWQERGELSAELDTEVVGEMIGRLIISLIRTPKSVIPIYNQNQARDFARRYLVPLVLQAPAPAPG
jgi:hypothetical protein